MAVKKKTPVVIADKNGAVDYNGIKARNVTYDEISRVPLATYLVKAGRFLNTVPAVFYDTAVYDAGTAISQQHKARLFTKGLGDSSEVVNTGAAIASKSEVLTNMTGDGEFEGGVTFILEEINVDLFICSDKMTGYAGGEITNPTLTSLANFSASAHFYAITRQFKLTFLRNEQPIISGLLYEFPSLFLASAAFGNDEGFIQNGFGRQGWNKLPRARVLESADKFHFVVEPLGQNGFTSQVPFNIRVNMVGKAIRPLFE